MSVDILTSFAVGLAADDAVRDGPNNASSNDLNNDMPASSSPTEQKEIRKEKKQKKAINDFVSYQCSLCAAAFKGGCVAFSCAPATKKVVPVDLHSPTHCFMLHQRGNNKYIKAVFLGRGPPPKNRRSASGKEEPCLCSHFCARSPPSLARSF